MTFIDILEAQLTVDEDKRNTLYFDSENIPTIGIGHNLRDRPISERAIRVIFEDDTKQAVADARRLFPNFDRLTEARKAVVCNMSFNLGYHRLAGFHKMVQAVCDERFDDAADEMLDSKWANQVGDRAKRLAEVMRHG